MKVSEHVGILDHRIARIAEPCIAIVDRDAVALVGVRALLGAGRRGKVGQWKLRSG
jgi:hypothetical protein